MTKTLEHLNKLIQETEKQMTALREQYDRQDANHPERQVVTAQEITATAKTLERFLNLKISLLGEGKTK